MPPRSIPGQANLPRSGSAEPQPDRQDGELWIAVPAFIASVTLFCWSFWFPAFFFDAKNPQPYPPWAVLVFGPLSGFLAWFANPFLAVSWLSLLSKPIRDLCVTFSCPALLLSLWFLTNIGDPVPGENKIPSPTILRVGNGYWLWLASIVVAFAGAVAITAARRLRPKSGGPDCDNAAPVSDATTQTSS